MKVNNHIFRSLSVFLLILFSVYSCKKDEKPVYDYFVSSELSGTYTESYINSMLAFVSTLYPELEDIVPFINDGVSVYKIVYKTVVNGQDIEASGLVSIPSTPGEYPVLSFQNGTNTVNSKCPSEAPDDYFYQLVEYIASMGFVVIIPDYPGFGSSSDIPHPYLITEPTTESITDMFRAVSEAVNSKFPGTTLKNEYYLMGYSQGGWATMALHKYLDADLPVEFNLAGSACGAGPYNLYDLLYGIANAIEYPMPSYLGYIINAYWQYDQFTNPVSDLLNEPYASRLETLYTGTLTLGEINDQLTTSIPGLLRQEFITGFSGSPVYEPVRDALRRNSIDPWISNRPLLLMHGDSDTDVNISATGSFYEEMINAGTSTSLLTKLIFPGLDHSEAAVPSMTEGIKFIMNLREQ